MFKIILILVLIKNIRVYGDDDRFEKYIDLLPEEEKEEFLDRIARRILEGIGNENLNDNNGSNKPDVEINDEQLDTHDVYVKNILREETKRHENDKKKDDPVKNEEAGGDNDDESKYIDLTLRDGKVLKINGEEELLVTSEIPYNVIPVKTVYDDVNDDPSQTENRKLEENESTRLKYESENLSNISSNHIKNEDSLRKSFQNDLNSTSTSMYIDNISVTEDYSINTESALPTSEKNKNNTNSDLVIKETNYNSQDFGGLNKNVGTESSIAASNVATTVSSIYSSLYDEEDKHESTTFTIKDTEIGVQNTLNNINQNFQRSSNIENISTDVASTTDAKEVNTSNLAKLTNIEDSRIVTLTNQINESKDKLKNDLHLRSDNKKSKEVLSVKELDAKPRRGEEYEVFEVAADKSPFKLISKVKTNNQPRYVPIYDYASENAYFRPYDKFGPKGVEHEKLKHYNIVEEKDENEFDTNFFSRNRFSGYNNDGGNQFRMKYNYPIQTENSKFYGFMKPVQTHFVSNINPYDYFDMDYTNGNNGRYILRSVYDSDKIFPNSHESDHPFNSMHKSDSVKDHVRAVRQLLYLQKRFGYIPEVDKELRKSDGNTKKLKPFKKSNKKLFEDSQEKISMDYYYDRADDERKDSENVELRENSSKIKILVPAQSELAEDFNKVLNTINEKYLSETNSFENINKLIQTEVDEKGFSLFFDAMVEVLKDMISLHDESLESYDWLRSSVDIQTAVWKLLDLTENLKHGEVIHPKDLELLKYCLYLFKSSNTSLHKYGRENRVNVKKRERKALLPKNRKNKGIKHPLVLWKDFAKYIRNINYSKNEQNLGLLNDFEDFLKNVQTNLNDLHDAIKHISMVTTFDQQNWFSDLKKIYLRKANKKKLGVVLLHLSVLILVDNLEDEAAVLSKVNFRLFVEANRDKVKETRRKFVFVLRVLDELNRINV
ncbi:unnamed protein product [Euphydryas editha]|uniref:Uncharacterized protein n=1 Tax=Euphydryas editha TaxID=104508 RepID=A0AAU9TD42_EUPED|nr:unnamed protein product [Euphydryas editha]